MRRLKQIWIFITLAAFLSIPPAASAWNQRSYYKTHSGHTDHIEKMSNRHHKRFRHHKNFHSKHSPSWKNHQHRLHYRFGLRSHGHHRFRYHSFRGHGYNWFQRHGYERFRKYHSVNRSFRGWDLIRKGHSHNALRVFGSIASRHPHAGEPKIGYAIAAAQARRMDDGVRAMRRALRYDPDSLSRVRLHGSLYNELHRLAKRYQSRSHGVDSSDRYFMAASLYYLMGERENYIEVLEKNHATRDRSKSTINLYRLAGFNG